MDERSNFRHIGGGHYIVKTQAGFKQALKHAGAAEYETEGHPTSYPAVIHISVQYRGCHFARVDAMHVNTMRSLLNGV